MQSLRIDILPKGAQKEIRDFYEFLILKYNRPKKAKQKRPFGLAKGDFVVPDDFNKPLPDDIIDAFYS